MPRPPKHDPAQEELALSSVASHAVFPGRKSLYVQEVAEALTMSENQVIDLIESGELYGVDISSGLKTKGNPNGNKTERKYWRIPVSAYDKFIQDRKSV